MGDGAPFYLAAATAVTAPAAGAATTPAPLLADLPLLHAAYGRPVTWWVRKVR